METSIADFHTSLYIPEIKKLEFHLPHVSILGTNFCGNIRHEAFTRCIENQYVLCCSVYYDRLIASFSHKIQSKYYVGDLSVSIEEIELENFSATTQTET